MLAKRFFYELTSDELRQLQQDCQRNRTQRTERSHEHLQDVNDRYPDTAWLEQAERDLDEAEQRLGRGK